MNSVASETGISPLTSLQHQYLLSKICLSPGHFIGHCCHIYDATDSEWIPFHLWPQQLDALETIQKNRLTVILKARQLGMTYLCLCYALWLAMFHPVATILLFSRRDDEAVDLLANRLRGIYERLPDWLKEGDGFPVHNDHEWEFSNGSRILAFPTTAGDSYTATLAIVDEADLVPDLGRLMNAVKPTIDGGGQMILLSRADKSQPESIFKKIYRGAKEGVTPWKCIFLPWSARPERDQAWYEEQRTDILHRTGSLDDLQEQYPATDLEALAPRTLDKRISAAWLQQCYEPVQPWKCPFNWTPRPPAIPGLVIYEPGKPAPGRYVIGIDPAEGNPTSNDSALTVLNVDTGHEVATLAGRIQPTVMAQHALDIAIWFNHASIMVERNNHGHAVIAALDGKPLTLLVGEDRKRGWLSSNMGKTILYNTAADVFRNGETMLRTFRTFTQLASIDGSTLKAPEGEMDDLADSYALALAGMVKLKGSLGDQVPLDKMVLGRGAAPLSSGQFVTGGEPPRQNPPGGIRTIYGPG